MTSPPDPKPVKPLILFKKIPSLKDIDKSGIQRDSAGRVLYIDKTGAIFGEPGDHFYGYYGGIAKTTTTPLLPNPLTATTKWLGNLLDTFLAGARHWTFRVVEVVIGGLLIIVGVAKLTDTIGPVNSIAKALK